MKFNKNRKLEKDVPRENYASGKIKGQSYHRQNWEVEQKRVSFGFWGTG